jgi:GDP-L-fucose synthase
MAKRHVSFRPYVNIYACRSLDLTSSKGWESMESMEFKKVLVTGGAGFLGRRVVAELAGRGYQDIIIPRSNVCDLTEQASVRELVHSHKPDLVVHLAAVVGGIGANQENPGKYFYDNMMMGVMLIEECRLAKVKKVVVLGTICAYPKFTPVPFHEEDLWNGYPEETNAPYGLAKKMLLVQSQAYRKQYGMNSIYLLSVNLYGPEDNFDERTSHVIPALIKKCMDAKAQDASEIVLWGDGSPIREFLYVDDAARGIIDAAEKYNDSQPVNLGSGAAISVSELAAQIAKETEYTGKIIWDTSKPNGQLRRHIDTSRARELFGFESSTTLNDGLKKTIEWYAKNQSLVFAGS